MHAHHTHTQQSGEQLAGTVPGPVRAHAGEGPSGSSGPQDNMGPVIPQVPGRVEGAGEGGEAWAGSS